MLKIRKGKEEQVHGGLEEESRKKKEAGKSTERLERLADILAFIEMSGTVQTNNYHQTNIAECSNQSLQEPGLVAESERLENAEVSEAVPPIQPNREKRLIIVTVPPDRSKELKVIEKEIRRI